MENIKDYEYIQDKKDKAYDKNGNEICLNNIVFNGYKNIYITSGILEVLQPFFRTGKFSIKYLYLTIIK
jgi:hypothetical protein